MWSLGGGASVLSEVRRQRLPCHRQPPRARLPARLHPTGRPAEFQPRTMPHWHVVVPSVAPARVVALAVGGRRFCAPLALEGEPELRLRSKPRRIPSQRSRPCPYPTTGEAGVRGLERHARKGDCTVLGGNMEQHYCSDGPSDHRAEFSRGSRTGADMLWAQHSNIGPGAWVHCRHSRMIISRYLVRYLE